MDHYDSLTPDDSAVCLPDIFQDDAKIARHDAFIFLTDSFKSVVFAP